MVLKIFQILLVKNCKVQEKNITKASNGMMCYNLCVEKHFDLIILDINMPVLDGLQACKLIRKHYQSKL